MTFLGLEAGEWLKLVLGGTGLAIAKGIRTEWKRRTDAMRAREQAAIQAEQSRELLAKERELRGELILKNVEKLIVDMEHMNKQMVFDDGKGLKEVIVRMLDQMRVEQVARRLGQGHATWEGQVQPDGKVIPTHVSPEWVRLTGMSHTETDNGGWALAVCEHDYDRVVMLAEKAAQNRTIFSAEYDCKNVVTGTCTRVRHIGIPIVTNDAQKRLIAWYGELTEIPEFERRGKPQQIPEQL